MEMLDGSSMYAFVTGVPCSGCGQETALIFRLEDEQDGEDEQIDHCWTCSIQHDKHTRFWVRRMADGSLAAEEIKETPDADVSR